MKKTTLENGQVVYCNEEDMLDPLLISDVIEALLDIYNKYGNINVRQWNDGIPKNVKRICTCSTFDGNKTIAIFEI